MKHYFGQKKFWMHGSVIVMLSVIFGLFYFTNHGWGAWGGDAGGYTFLANRLYQHQPLINDDPLARAALYFFQDPKIAAWVLPSHHHFINIDGSSASKYPIGLPLLLALFAELAQSSLAMYWLIPVCGVINITLLYILVVLMLPNQAGKVLIASLAAVSLGVSYLYFLYAVAEPLRELPVLTFILLAAVLSLAVVRWLRWQTWQYRWAIWWIGVCIGFATTIRETAALFVVVMVAYFASIMRVKQYCRKEIIIVLGLALLGLAVGFAPQMLYSIQLVVRSEPSSLTPLLAEPYLPNLDHIYSLSPTHLFFGEGKYQPGYGGAQFYIRILSNVIPLPLVFFLAILGAWYTYQHYRPQFWLALTWLLSIFLLFGMWINPYPRYIIPAFPPYIIFVVMGLAAAWQGIRRFVHWHWLRGLLVAAFTVIVVMSYYPTGQYIFDHLTNPYPKEKSITREDAQTINTLGDDIINESERPIILMTGQWKWGLSEQLFGHTGLRAVLSPVERKHPITVEAVAPFFEDYLLQEYDVYVWIDETTDPVVVQWLESYSQTVVTTVPLSLNVEPAQIVRLAPVLSDDLYFIQALDYNGAP